MAKRGIAAPPSSARPLPPPEFADPMNSRFSPAPNVLTWARREILTAGGALHNVDHAHLEYADLAFLWAPAGFVKQGRVVLGQCEELTFRCSPWQKGRQQQQMRDWFDGLPDFLITLDAQYCLQCTDAEFCALVEHELYHIGQEKDEFGGPAFTKDGMPKLFIRGHDVSEFVGIVQRYGVGAPDGDVARMVAAANAGPELKGYAIAQACGTCMVRTA